MSNLLANDFDLNVGDVISLASFDAMSANGNNIAQNANGDLVLDIGSRYQLLAAGQTVTDSFTYTITDQAGATTTATVIGGGVSFCWCNPVHFSSLIFYRTMLTR